MTEHVPTVVADLEGEHRAIWGRAAETYAAGVEALTGAAVGALLDAAAVGTGTALLDVGTGPGTLIGPALERGAVVHAVDLTPGMVEVARTRFPGADIQVATATELPFPDQRFDAVTLGFCLHHMAEPAAALTEVLRVLRPGGHVALTVWAPDEQLEAFGLAFGALEGLDAEISFPSPLPLDGAGPDALEPLLTAAGFTATAHRQLDLTWELADPTPLADLMARFLGLDTGGDRVVAAYTARVDAAVRERNARVGTTAVPNPAVLATARRPD